MRMNPNEQLEQDLAWERGIFDALERHEKAIESHLLAIHALATERWGNHYAVDYVRGSIGSLIARLFPHKPHLNHLYRKANIPEELRWQVFERDDFRCRTCGGRRILRADHIIPESKGSLTTLDNLQTLCGSCNSSKGVRLHVGQD